MFSSCQQRMLRSDGAIPGLIRGSIGMQVTFLVLSSGLIFGRFYSRYSVIFPMPKSIFISQFSEENSQFQVLKNFENKSSVVLVKVGLKMCVQHVYSGFPITKISVV